MKTAIIRNDLEVEDMRLEDGYEPRELEAINFLIIHHSATPKDTTAEAIRNYHMNTNGWPGIGYNFLVYDDGHIVYVGDIATIRAHTYSYNTDGIGICLVGNFDEEQPSAKQLEATKTLCANLQYGLGWFVPILGHRDMLLNRATHCPGLSWPAWKRKIDP